MDYLNSRKKFVKGFGDLGCNWGVNKTMGQIHALLLISKKPMCCESIMNELDISRGNANMNLRALIKWELIYKNCADGCRKEFFRAEKDIWQAFRMIVKHRKEKELSPLISLIQEMSDVEGSGEEYDEFRRVLTEMGMFSNKADSALNSLIQSKSNLLINSISKILR